MIESLFWMTMLVSGMLFYFMPAGLVLARHHHNALAIAAVNTLLGWLVTLIWSLTAVRR